MNSRSILWRHVIIFCVLAFALLWIPFLGMTLASGEGDKSGIFGIAFGILGPYSPLIAAIVMRTIIAREGFRDAHLGVRGVPARYWLLALLLPFFWNGMQDALQVLLGFAELDWTELPSGKNNLLELAALDTLVFEDTLCVAPSVRIRTSLFQSG